MSFFIFLVFLLLTYLYFESPRRSKSGWVYFGLGTICNLGLIWWGVSFWMILLGIVGVGILDILIHIYRVKRSLR